MVAINQDAPFFFCQAAIPHLLETDGNIVNIASNAGLMGQAYTVAYCMTKGAVIQLTRSLAMEFAKTEHPGERHRPGRHRDQPHRQLHHARRHRLRPHGALHGLPGHGPGRRHRRACSASWPPTRAQSIHGAILSSDNGVTAG